MSDRVKTWLEAHRAREERARKAKAAFDAAHNLKLYFSVYRRRAARASPRR